MDYDGIIERLRCLSNPRAVEGMARFGITPRQVYGVYHAVSAKHLQGYLNEYAWRYSYRGDDRALFEILLLRAARAA